MKPLCKLLHSIYVSQQGARTDTCQTQSQHPARKQELQDEHTLILAWLMSEWLLISSNVRVHQRRQAPHLL